MPSEMDVELLGRPDGDGWFRVYEKFGASWLAAGHGLGCSSPEAPLLEWMAPC